MEDIDTRHVNDDVASLVASCNHEDFDQLAFLCFSCVIVLDNSGSNVCIIGLFGWELVIVHAE